MTTERMTKGEREDLQRLIRQREKVLKSAAKMRSTELLADFESQMAAQYRFDDDEVWAAATKAAEAEVQRAQQRVEARCRELGIPKQFAPGLRALLASSWLWQQSEGATRRTSQGCVGTDRGTRTAGDAQESSRRRSRPRRRSRWLACPPKRRSSFVGSLPAVESLMPALSYSELSGEADPPIVEQLITPNALRQRRFRERQAALRNAAVTAIDSKEESDGE